MNTLAIAMIPGVVQRGPVRRQGTPYAQYSLPSWRHWAARHGVRLLELTQPVFPDMPPTWARWLWAREALAGVEGMLAMVDADTMIRHNAPGLFELCGPGVSAVLDRSRCQASAKAYGALLGGRGLPGYFNSGLVVFGPEATPALDEFARCVVESKVALLAAAAGAGDIGSDQTLLNFAVSIAGVPFTWLPETWNHSTWPARVRPAIEESYVWHFAGHPDDKVPAMKFAFERNEAHYYA